MRDINSAVADILNLRYGLGITSVTEEQIDTYVKRVLIMAHDIFYVELKEDHEEEEADGKKK